MSTAIAERPSATAPLAPLFEAYAEGSPALLVAGRPLYDLVADDYGGMRPLVESLRRTARELHRMHMVTYSMASGVDWDPTRGGSRGDRDDVERTPRGDH